MRFTARRDAAEEPIVDALRAVGAVVRHLDGLDLPDLLVAFRGAWHLIEVKTGKAKLRRGQEAFVQLVAAAGAQIHVCRTPEEALEALGLRTRRGS